MDTRAGLDLYMINMQARTTVQAHLMRPDLLVEVTATAAVST